MAGATKLFRYARDIVEVLLVKRLWGTATERSLAGEAASTVRQTRFHAHARIRPRDLADILADLSPARITSVTLPGPLPLHGVGSMAYYHALGALAQAVDPRLVLEFGTYFGIGTFTIAANTSPSCRIVTVDLPDVTAQEDLHGLNRTDVGLVEQSRDRVGEAFLDSPFKDRVEQVRADSLRWRADETLSNVDLVLIDGGHSTELVKADTDNAFRVLAPEGVILWDDYFHLYPDVVRYLDGLAADGLPLQAVRGTNLVLYSSRCRPQSAGNAPAR